MAIHGRVPGIAVTVKIEGKYAKEYGHTAIVRELEGQKPVPSLSTYIEAVNDKAFPIAFTVGSPFKLEDNDLTFTIILDGKLVHVVVLTKEMYAESHVCAGSVHGIFSKDGQLRKFTFSKIETTSEENNFTDLTQDEDYVRSVGEIVVRVHRVVLLETLEPIGNDNDLAADREVHEKALKGQTKSHRISLGPARQSNRLPVFFNYSHVDGAESPIVTYKFIYLSKESLKHMMIMKPSPEPEPMSPSRPHILASSNSSRAAEVINAEDMEEPQGLDHQDDLLPSVETQDHAEERHVHQQGDFWLNTARQREDTESSAAMPTPKKIRGVIEGEVIDLTGDD